MLVPHTYIKPFLGIEIADIGLITTRFAKVRLNEDKIVVKGNFFPDRLN